MYITDTNISSQDVSFVDIALDSRGNYVSKIFLEYVNAMGLSENFCLPSLLLSIDCMQNCAALAEKKYPGVAEILRPGLEALNDAETEVTSCQESVNELIDEVEIIKSMIADLENLTAELALYSMEITPLYESGLSIIEKSAVLKEKASTVARKAAHASHIVTNQAKVDALKEWGEKSHEYSSMSAFAEYKHKKYGVKARTLYDWIRKGR